MSSDLKAQIKYDAYGSIIMYLYYISIFFWALIRSNNYVNYR